MSASFQSEAAAEEDPVMKGTEVNTRALDVPTTGEGSTFFASHLQRSMKVDFSEVSPEAELALATQYPFFGTGPNEPLQPLAPGLDEFVYPDLDLEVHQLPPKLVAPTAPEPPPGKAYPLAPSGGYTLEKDSRYLGGYVYTTPYHLSQKAVHRERLLNLATPPNILPQKVGDGFVSHPIPGMVKLIPGIPFAVKINGEQSRTHTIACLQTLESLRTSQDYAEIEALSVQLGMLTWGCPENDSFPQIEPVFHLLGLKLNDRAQGRSSFHHHTLDGSFSLGATVMKGDGPGTFLPAVQAATPQAKRQITTILRVLSRLFQLIAPKCLAKSEWEMLKFIFTYNNVFSFGGIDPNGSGLQLNNSSLGALLSESIGIIQGTWHKDLGDDPVCWTLFTLLLRLGPNGDPGPFCLARSGLYIREHNVWIVWLLFKGTDLHSGFAPSEDPEAHRRWVASTLDSAWNLAGPQNRVGYVNYPGSLPTRRLGALNVSPPTFFGNYGTNSHDKSKELNFAQHGHVALGGSVPHAIRMAREAFFGFFNNLQHANLTLDIDLNEIFSQIKYTDAKTGSLVSVGSLPYNPVTDAAKIRRLLSLYAWYRSEADAMDLRITKASLNAANSRASRCQIDKKNSIASFGLQPRPLGLAEVQIEEGNGDAVLPEIEEIISWSVKNSKIVYEIRLANNSIEELFEDSPRLRMSRIFLDWLATQAPLPSLERVAQRMIPYTSQEGLTAAVKESESVSIIPVSKPTSAIIDGSASSTSLPLDEFSSTFSPCITGPPIHASDPSIEQSSVPIIHPRPQPISVEGGSSPSFKLPISGDGQSQSSPAIMRRVTGAHSSPQPQPSNAGNMGNSSAPPDLNEVQNIVEQRDVTSSQSTQANQKHKTSSNRITRSSQSNVPIIRPRQQSIGAEDGSSPSFELPISGDRRSQSSPVIIRRVTEAHSSPQPQPSNAGNMGNSSALPDLDEVQNIVEQRDVTSSQSTQVNQKHKTSSSRITRSSQKSQTRPDNTNDQQMLDIPAPSNEAGSRSSRKRKKTSDEEEFEVETILGHRNRNEGAEFYIKWKGYAEPSWTAQCNLEGCVTMLSDYTKMHPELELELNSTESSGEPPARKKPRPDEAPVRLAQNINTLQQLLSELDAKIELQRFESQHSSDASSKLSYNLTPYSPSNILHLWYHQAISSNYLARCLAVSPKESIQKDSVYLELLQVVTANLSPMISFNCHVDVITRGIQREICRALITIFDWCSYVEPRLAQRLVHIHQVNGYDGLAASAPGFENLVDHVIQHVVDLFTNKIATQKGTKKSMDPGLATRLRLGPSRKNPSLLPADLYGLRAETESKAIKLDSCQIPRRSVIDSEAVYDAAIKCLQSLWRKQFVMPALRTIDKGVQTSRHSSDTDSNIFNRCITRGAILSCLFSACSGCDGILASGRMKTFLESPALVFETSYNRDQKFAPRVLDDRNRMLKPLFEAVEECLQQNPGLLSAAQKLGDSVTQCMLDLHNGGLGVVKRKSRALPSAVRKNRSIKNTLESRSTVTLPTLNIPLASVLKPGTTSIQFSALGLILREALNYRKGRPAANPVLRNVLLGLSPAQNSSSSHNPDHTNPARIHSIGVQLLQEHIPPAKLTRREGLSNLLSFMGTGQGYSTQDFLQCIARPSGFFSSSLDEMIEIFETAVNHNDHIRSYQGVGYSGKEKRSEGLIVYDDMKVWGTPNHHLSVFPNIQGRERTVAEKFAPYWKKEVQDAWVNFLDDMLDQNPTTWAGLQKTWEDVMAFIISLDIVGFKDGLTLLHTSNAITILGVVSGPQIESIASWSAGNKNLGACKGLNLVGLNVEAEKGTKLSAIDQMKVQIGFKAIHTHLDEFMSAEDKDCLGFDVPFVEHALCKVARWESRFKSAGLLETWHSWIEGTRLEAESFPFPLVMAEEKLKFIIDELMTI